jgi:signal transduction histidine kinase
MKLKEIIALKVIALLTLMIIAVSTANAYYAIMRNRTMTLNLWKTRSLVLAEGFKRLILWDDRLAIKQMMLSEKQGNDTLLYCFLVKGETPYVYTFETGVPPALLQQRPPATGQPVWEFQDKERMVAYDIATIIDNSGTTLHLGLKRSAIDEKMQPLITAIVLIGLFTIAISSFLAVRIARRTTREVDTLAAAISRYGELNDDNGLTIDATTSEISDLVSSFKQLTARRKTAEMELAALNAQLEMRVTERTAQLTAANKELDSFAYSVSHDLRAPLRGVEGFSYALLEEYADKLDETGKDYINRIRKGCVRMGKLIDDLLKLSRITRSEINRTSVDLVKVAEQAIMDLKNNDPDREVEIRIEPGMTAIADLTLIRTVLENLLGNAWKFTRNVARPVIQFSSMKKDKTCIYCIKDNGAGFNMEYADKLFLPFQRLHRTDEFEGTGIGLASVHRVLLMHGGKIWAESEEGIGSTFYFTLEH